MHSEDKQTDKQKSRINKDILSHVLNLDRYEYEGLIIPEYLINLYKENNVIINSSPLGAMFLRELYYENVLHVDSNNLTDEYYYSTILYRECEDSINYTSFSHIVNEYVSLEINKYFGLSIDEYLDLTFKEKDMYIRKANEYKSLVEQDLKNLSNLDRELSKGLSNV